jgi:MFS family permease
VRTSSTYSAVLRNDVARRLLLTQSISELGDYVGLSALMLLAFGRAGSVVASGAVLAVNGLPSLAVGTVLSPWLDRPARRAALVGLSILGAMLTATVAAAPYLVVALLVAAALGAMRTAAVSISMAVVVVKVPEETRTPYFGLVSGIYNSAGAVGLLAGASITLTIGPRVALGFDALTFVVGAILLRGLPSMAAQTRQRRPPALQGLRTVLSTPTLSMLAPVVWIGCMVMGFPEAIAPGIAKGSALPLLMASWSIGTACSSMVVSGSPRLRAVSTQLRLALAFGLTFGLGAIVLALGGGGWGLLPVNAAVGALVVWVVGVRATFARCTPPERMAQVEATMIASNNIAGGVGTIGLAGVAAALGAAASYAVAGGLVSVAVLLVLRRATVEEPAVVAAGADPAIS